MAKCTRAKGSLHFGSEVKVSRINKISFVKGTLRITLKALLGENLLIKSMQLSNIKVFSVLHFADSEKITP